MARHARDWLLCDEAQQFGRREAGSIVSLVKGADIQSQFGRRRWWQGQWCRYEHCGARQERSSMDQDYSQHCYPSTRAYERGYKRYIV